MTTLRLPEWSSDQGPAVADSRAGSLALFRLRQDQRPEQGALLVPEDEPAAPRPAATSVVKFHAPEIVFGHGSLAEAGHCALRLGGRRPFVVTDPGIIEAGWVHELLGHLAEVGLKPRVWADVSPNPKDHEVTAAYQAYTEWGCDVLIGIGGGSCIDAAKAVAILFGNGGSILDYAGVDRAQATIPPMVMIPTTSGTGADVSQFCIVTDTARSQKITIMGRALVPDISVTDPRLLTTMPDELNAATGLDALTHGVEAFVSLAHNPLTDIHALTAVRLVATELEHTLAAPDDLAARTSMAQASLEAGLAFTNAILGATHAMSHQVGGLLDAPHGVVNGVLLPHVIRYNAAHDPQRFVPLAQSAGLPVDGVPADEAAHMLSDWVRELADRVGVPRGLRELGVRDCDLVRLSRATLEDACLTTNPRGADEAEVAAIFRAAL